MSFAIIQTVVRYQERRHERAMLEEVNGTMKLVRFGAERFFSDVEEVAVCGRSPMVNLQEYVERQSARSTGTGD
jgi:hypothetical protein